MDTESSSRRIPRIGNADIGGVQFPRCLARVVAAVIFTWVPASELKAQDAAEAPPDMHPEAVATLPKVVVNASRFGIAPFNLPAALHEVPIRHDDGQPGVNLSESLVGVPGILARDRQNYAQDEQISIRGFGARATFGVRSIRLFVDGIPATTPDGQGQVSHFNFDGADRLEVLSGPFSVLYGNAAGGVVQLWSADGTSMPVSTVSAYAGSYDTFRYGARTSGTWGSVDDNLAGSEFLSGGFREHSRVQRESDNAKFGIDLGARKKLTVVLNRLDQPTSQDPLGLTREQVDADPRQATAVAIQFNTRKSISQNQIGSIYEQEIDDADQLRLMDYVGRRNVLQFQSIPTSAQANPLQSGGVVAPDTGYEGYDLRWTRDGQLAGRDGEFVFGISGDYQHQHRRGYENFVGDQLGVMGALRRDEDDNVINLAQYGQWYWQFAPRWSLLLGVRHDAVRFSEHDFYITAFNPDDSDHVRFGATTPVAGLDFHASDAVRLYASYGKGFETPSFNELGYRSDGQPGLAFNLLPTDSRNLELGAKWRARSALEFDAAAFRADSRNELVVATNANGRATYQNAGSSRRQGIELSLDGQLGNSWSLTASATWLQARFRSSFLTCVGTPCTVPATQVPAGSRIPGVPDAYGSLRLQHGTDEGWREGLTVSGVGAIAVSDTSDERAPGYGLVDVDVGYTIALGEKTRMQLSARIDNVANRRYIGTVIVNDANDRFYEPGPDRTYGLGARFTF